MDEYINRDDLLKAAWDKPTLSLSVYDIGNIKPVDVAPVRYGRWIEHKHFHHDHYIDSTYECSECKVEEPLTSDYCPNCGAKMMED